MVVFAFVGHLGAVATAAMGAALQFTFLLFPIFNALSIGTVALVSRRLGEGRRDEADRIVRQSLLLGAVLGIASGVAFAALAKPLLGLIGAAPDVAAVGAPYLALVGGLNVFQTISIIGMAAIRAAGDTRTPMIFSAVFSLLNVPLTYLLMNAAGLGVVGAAIGLVVTLVLFAGATVALLWRGHAGLTIAGGPWALSTDRLRTLLAISLPSAAESLLFSVGILALSGLVFRLGTEAFAAHQIITQLESLSFLPCIGFAAAASALVGQSLGMDRPGRAMHVGWAAARMAALWTTAAGVLLAVFPGAFIGIFTSDPGVVVAGTGSMVIVGLAQPAQAVIFTIGGALRGAGDTRYTLSPSSTGSWCASRSRSCSRSRSVSGSPASGWLSSSTTPCGRASWRCDSAAAAGSVWCTESDRCPGRDLNPQALSGDSPSDCCVYHFATWA